MTNTKYYFLPININLQLKGFLVQSAENYIILKHLVRDSIKVQIPTWEVLIRAGKKRLHFKLRLHESLQFMQTLAMHL